jgi:hypothetical protein
LRSIGPPATPRKRAVWEAERAIQAVLVRDIFGPLPFHNVCINASILAWNDGLIMKLARAAYEGYHLPDGTLYSDRLTVLADALEEAGVTDALLLEHLRGPGPHVRGCFVIDAILGRT